MNSPYNPYLGPYQVPMNQPTGLHLEKVGGIEEAKKYVTQLNSITYFLDEAEPYMYMKVTDSNGQSTIRAFQIKETDIAKLEDNKRYITREDLDSFKKELIETIVGRKGNNNESTTGNGYKGKQ